jgi:hypothetical protein
MHVFLAWNCCDLSPNLSINHKIFISQIHESVLLLIIFSEAHYSQLGISFNTPKPANQAGSQPVQNEFSAIVLGNSLQHAPHSQHTLAVSHAYCSWFCHFTTTTTTTSCPPEENVASSRHCPLFP